MDDIKIFTYNSYWTKLFTKKWKKETTFLAKHIRYYVFSTFTK